MEYVQMIKASLRAHMRPRQKHADTWSTAEPRFAPGRLGPVALARSIFHADHEAVPCNVQRPPSPAGMDTNFYKLR